MLIWKNCRDCIKRNVKYEPFSMLATLIVATVTRLKMVDAHTERTRDQIIGWPN